MNLAVPSSPSVAGPRPLQLVDGNVQSPAVSSCPSPTLSGLSTPPPGAQKFNSRGHPRRQSSISYYPSDHTPSWDVRSPTTASRQSSLRRSTSLNQKAPSHLNLKGDRRSLPLTEIVCSPQSERPPLTLTEKHADLLRFIAQKESKCLELRSQLAAHEAELAQLKRKWERIVSRGMDRAYANQPATPSSSATSSTAILLEGVKDVSRILSAGLELSSPTPTPSAATPARTMAGHLRHEQAPRTPVLALKTGSARPHHATSQSTSSASTSTTSTSMTTSSVRLSQSSASSLAFDESPQEEDEEPEATTSAAPLQRTPSSMRVDGGTGIESPIQISPASALAAAKLHRRKSRDAPPLPPSPLSTLPEEEPRSRRAAKRMSMPAGVGAGTSSGMPPAASISGLTSPLASTWMESVGSSVGKKWGELQKGQTFTKSQKRASLLISDAASSLFAALSSPSPGSSSSHAASTSSVSVSANPFGAAISPLGASPTAPSSMTSLLDTDDGTADGLGSVLVPDRATLTPTPAATLVKAKTLSFSASTPPMATPRSGRGSKPAKSLLDDDDEWNW